MKQTFNILANWDDEAAVWVAESDDIPGLVTEAETFEALIAKLKVMIPELLEANGALMDDKEIPFTLLSSCTTIAQINHG